MKQQRIKNLFSFFFHQHHPEQAGNGAKMHHLFWNLRSVFLVPLRILCGIGGRTVIKNCCGKWTCAWWKRGTKEKFSVLQHGEEGLKRKIIQMAYSVSSSCYLSQCLLVYGSLP
jgi:hypothetical protein